MNKAKLSAILFGGVLLALGFIIPQSAQADWSCRQQEYTDAACLTAPISTFNSCAAFELSESCVLDGSTGTFFNTSCLAEPSGYSPSDSSTVVPGLTTFSWNAVPGALAYRYEVQTLSGTPIQAGCTTGTSFTRTLSDGNTLNWTVSPSFTDPCSGFLCGSLNQITAAAVPTLQVAASASPVSPAVNQDVTVTAAKVSGTATGDVTFELDCDGLFPIELSRTVTNASALTGISFSPGCSYSSSGLQTITIEGKQQGVNDFDTTQVTVAVAGGVPVASFTTSPPRPPTINEGASVTFTDTSAGTITDWTWNFGDGTPPVTQSFSTNPAHTYTSAGSFTASLLVEGPGGTDTDFVAVAVSSGGGGPGSGVISFKPPIAGVGSIQELIARLASILFTLALILAPILLVVAGIVFMTAAGNPGRVSQAKSIALWTVIGFIVILVSTGIVAVVQSILGL